MRIWLLLLLLAGCDAVRPEDTSHVVVEAYVIAGEPAGQIRLWRSLPLDAPYPFDASTGVDDADLSVIIGEAALAYSQTDPGQYTPNRRLVIPEYARLNLQVNTLNERITATSGVPPRIQIDSIRVKRSVRPVRGLILDSLLIDPTVLDSLGVDSLRVGAQEANIYLVEATLHWTVQFIEQEADSAWWVRTHLAPDLESVGRTDEYFLRTEQVQRERQAASNSPGHRYWSGVYAVPVESPDAAIPVHRLRLSLVRSPPEYARFVAGRSSPGDREPPTNLIGARGIFTGLAMDSVVVRVE
ncbi:MAG: DUF4249 family protein [Bacteroidota bacterium]|nr:DUF4249 family protein [Bacteroidota bacterium]MDE2956998.1 DUF4249 family protein [Bacteroidota bacterium]